MTKIGLKHQKTNKLANLLHIKTVRFRTQDSKKTYTL